MNYKIFKYYISESLLTILYISLLGLFKMFYIFGYGSFISVSAVKIISPVLWQSLYGKIYILYNYFLHMKGTHLLYKIPSIAYIVLGQVERKKISIYALVNVILLIIFLQKTGAWLYAMPWIVNLFLMLVYYFYEKKNNIFEAWVLIWIYSQIGTVCYGYLIGFLDKSVYSTIIFPIFIEKIIWTILYSMSQIIFLYIAKFAYTFSLSNFKYSIYKFFKGQKSE